MMFRCLRTPSTPAVDGMAEQPVRMVAIRKQDVLRNTHDRPGATPDLHDAGLFILTECSADQRGVLQEASGEYGRGQPHVGSADGSTVLLGIPDA